MLCWRTITQRYRIMEICVDTKHGQTSSQMSLLEELPASHSQSQDSEKEWPIPAADWPLSILQSLNDLAPTGWYGKTSPESCQKTKGGTLVPSSGVWSNSGMASPTECLTLSTAEYHSGAVVCSLSDILETGDVLQKYYLSPKACAGILRRAEKRGKELPTMLHRALEQVAQDLSEPEIPEGRIA